MRDFECYNTQSQRKWRKIKQLRKQAAERITGAHRPCMTFRAGVPCRRSVRGISPHYLMGISPPNPRPPSAAGRFIFAVWVKYMVARAGGFVVGWVYESI